MKIVLINSVAGTGSTGKIVRDLYNAYRDDGNDVKVIYGRGVANGIPDTDAVCFNTKMDFYYHALMSRIFDTQGIHSKCATKKMISYLQEYAPDVVHLHNIHGYYLNYKMLFEYLATTNIKVVWTLHDCMAFTGHCAYFDMAKCDRWKTGCHNCPNKREYPASMLCDNSKKQYELKKKLFTSIKDMIIVCPSKWLANKVKDSFLGKYNIEVINNGIDLTNFKPTDNHTFDKVIDRSKKIILAVANVWEARKGYKDIIELSTTLSDDYQIVMVGGSNVPAVDVSGTNIVFIHGTKNQVELTELYSMATAFINTTYQDNFPTVNIEALACGCPVITYATGGSVEAITDDNGIIIDQGDISALHRAIIDIDDMHIDRQALSDDAQNKYNSTIMCEKYMELFKWKIR